METGNKLKHRDIKSFRIDKNKIQKIVSMLFFENKKAQELEFNQFRKSKINDGLTNEELKDIVEENMKVTINVWGRDGEYKFERGLEDLDKFHWPQKVEMISIENFTQFDIIYKYRPVNNFFVRFDFGYTDIFDLITHPTNRTQNESKFEVLGTDSGWVHGVESQLNELVKPHENNFSDFVHTRNIYDFLLWLFFVPIYLVSISNWSEEVPIIQSNIIEPMQPVCFVVALVLGVYLFRLFFNITKRLFPFATLEGDLKEPKDIWFWGRALLYVITTSIIGTIFSGFFS